ncbi:chromate reductase [Sphingobacterium allocomposti]|uniref:Chromate reductase n=1 Tax=Sphingobacterium allocomposti TaxID=415956 RepID=A0A5S5DM17_9SPHI|nr:NAD(P)H-dependent oxidoreductase [Sphingobacterium composti Yoo et al. 2007 non Ten et al. 2007]TYP96977.1 chromate reductase [Sphingobacterium composti Yoo et al. 2007 non Ten et al. 2007]
MANKKIGVVVGSLRKESFNKKIANFLIENAPDGYNLELIEIGHLALYNQDYDEGDSPASYHPFREQIKSVDGVIFVTPEYNRSVPGVLKNAIDVGSRPYGKNSWDGKPALVISSSIGNISGFGANHHLRQSLVFLNMPTLQQPEVYIPNCQELFDDQGKLNNADTADFLRNALRSFVDFMEKLSA